MPRQPPGPRITVPYPALTLPLQDAETTRFDESFEEAKRAVSEAVGMFDALLSRLPGDEAGRLQRSMGLKMQQLKAELSRLETLHAEH